MRHSDSSKSNIKLQLILFTEKFRSSGTFFYKIQCKEAKYSIASITPINHCEKLFESPKLE